MGLSRLDYCNSCLKGVSETSLDRLQLVQNCAARLVTRTKRWQHITPTLMELLWLPIRQRIDYKVLMVTFNAVLNLAPDYLCDLIVPYNPACSLRSESKHLLSEQTFRHKSFGGRAFSTCAPRLWNSLPISLRSETDLDTFKRNLKSFQSVIDNFFWGALSNFETVVKALCKFKFHSFIHSFIHSYQ
jgi:hypothetical protein